MIWKLIAAVLLMTGISLAEDRPVFKVTDYGADLADDKPDDDAFSQCLKAAIEKGGICHIDAGKLILTHYPAELRQDGTITKNRDLNGMVIEGAGADETTVHGISAKGFDIFQLNGVANLTIRNLTITAEKTSKDETQGVNGISMTNGTANVLIEGVSVRKLPYVLKPGRFDGGKAFTVQQGTLGAASCTDIEVRDCQVFDTPIGFGLDADPNQKALPGKIAVRKNRFERVSLAFALSFSGKTAGGAEVPGFGIEITENMLIDVTRVLFIGRAPDVVFRDNTATTKALPDLPDPIIHTGIPIVLIGGPRAVLENNTIEYQPKVPTFVLVGSAGGNVNLDKVEMTGNAFRGPAEVGVKLLNQGVTNSRFRGNTFDGTKTERDNGLSDKKLKNTWSPAKPAAKTKR